MPRISSFWKEKKKKKEEQERNAIHEQWRARALKRNPRGHRNNYSAVFSSFTEERIREKVVHAVRYLSTVTLVRQRASGSGDTKRLRLACHQVVPAFIIMMYDN